MDDLYANEWRAKQNFFLPTMKLIAKPRVGGRRRRRYGKPCTPYQRLLHSPALSKEDKAQLRGEFENLDPFELNKRIEAKLRAISRLVKSRQKRMAQTLQTGDTQIPQKGATKTPIAA